VYAIISNTAILFISACFIVQPSPLHTIQAISMVYLSEKQFSLSSKPGLASYSGAKDDGNGGDNWSCKMCKAPVKLSPPTNQHPTFYRPDALPVAQPTAS